MARSKTKNLIKITTFCNSELTLDSIISNIHSNILRQWHPQTFWRGAISFA